MTVGGTPRNRAEAGREQGPWPMFTEKICFPVKGYISMNPLLETSHSWLHGPVNCHFLVVIFRHGYLVCTI